jgi:hypothetical protein
VWPGTEVNERAAILDRVTRDIGLADGLLVDQLHLQGFAALGEEGHRLVAWPALARKGQILLGHFPHLPLDRVEILGDERPRDDEVVEEAFVGGRTDAALHLWKQIGDRGGEQVRGAVAIEPDRFVAVAGHDAYGGIARERIRQVDHGSVNDRRKGCLGETR